MENHRSRPGNRLIAAAIALTLAAAAAHAAEDQAAAAAPAPAATPAAPADHATGGLEEIIVTGTMRIESSQDVPIAISAITAEAIAAAHINDVRALQNLAPGLVLSNPAGFNATGGGMRGTGTNIILVTQDAPVSFLMDGFALSHVSSQFLSLFDTQQVEVFRGPQGTLFGKNTTGGVISITSKRPIQGEYSAETQLSYGQYDNGAGGQHPAGSRQRAPRGHAGVAHRCDVRHRRRLLYRRQEHLHLPGQRAVVGPVRHPAGHADPVRDQHQHHGSGRATRRQGRIRFQGRSCCGSRTTGTRRT